MFTHSKGRVGTTKELDENHGDKSIVQQSTKGMKRGQDLGNIRHSPLTVESVGKAGTSRQNCERGVTGAARRLVVEMDGGSPNTGLDDWPVQTRKYDFPRKGDGGKFVTIASHTFLYC